MAEKKKEKAVCPVCNTVSLFYDHRVGHEGGAWGNITCATCGAEILELADPPPTNKRKRKGGMMIITSSGLRFFHYIGKGVPRPRDLALLQRISEIAVEL